MDVNTPTRPPSAQDDESRFLIQSRMEITFILRAIMQAGEMVAIHFNSGRDNAITALLSVDEPRGHFVFDCPSDPAVLRRMLTASKVSFLSRQDRIKVRWDSTSAQEVSFQGRPAVRLPLPQTLLKFQRREFFRAELPIARPIKCTIPLAEGGTIEVNLVDISLGGIGLTGFPATFPLDAETELTGCTITLPDLGILAVTLAVRSTIEIERPDGKIVRRAGCKFVGLPATAENMIQRFIIRLERERRSSLA